LRAAIIWEASGAAELLGQIEGSPGGRDVALAADWVGAAEPESFTDPTKTITAATTMALAVRRRA
jgi:hypothetical protein